MGAATSAPPIAYRGCGDRAHVAAAPKTILRSIIGLPFVEILARLFKTARSGAGSIGGSFDGKANGVSLRVLE